MTTPVFDTVVISATPEQRMSAAEFFQLPLSVRIEHMIARTASFFRNGREVDRVHALAEIRRLRAQP